MTTSTMTQTQLLLELEPVVGENLNRHLSMAKDWFPHEYVRGATGGTSTASSTVTRGRPTTHRCPTSRGPR
jgi:hypothetical protein